MNYSSSMETVSWFMDRYREGTLVIQPPFQRKPVWQERQKCFLIESMLKDLPVPELYIQQKTSADGRTKYAVVDGQQRIRATLQFIGAETDPGEQEYNKFTLDKLDGGSEWKNLAFADLSEPARSAFFGYQFAIRYLRTNNEDDVRDMFRRINKYLTPLKPQELRNATYSGPFAQLAENLADNEYWAENRIVTPAAIRRMGDIEFVSELLIGTLHGPQGGSAKLIDEYYAQYEDYEDEFPEERKARRLFDVALRAVQQMFSEVKNTRWANKTDFYSLFVALTELLRKCKPGKAQLRSASKALAAFEIEVDKRLADENAHVSDNAVDYVRAVEKGANDKNRRGARHLVLLNILEPVFSGRK